jgi:Nuclease-related domain
MDFIMKSIILSDHTATVIQEQQDKRTAAEKARVDNYQNQVRAYQAQVQLWQAKRDKPGKDLYLAWSAFGISFRLIKYIGPWISSRLMSKPVPPVPPAPPLRSNRPTQRELAWNAGNQGEQSVCNHLARLLNDQWTLVKGYRNYKGEIDFVAVGPTGVVALEVKNVNGYVSCDGDRWWIDKKDNYGTWVERGKLMTDRNGRSPARQVNESAGQLQSFLASRGVNLKVSRIVVLAHPKGWVGTCNNLTVDRVTRTDHLVPENLASNGCNLNTVEIGKVLDLIQRGHKHHNERGRS